MKVRRRGLLAARLVLGDLRRLRKPFKVEGVFYSILVIKKEMPSALVKKKASKKAGGSDPCRPFVFGCALSASFLWRLPFEFAVADGIHMSSDPRFEKRATVCGKAITTEQFCCLHSELVVR